jgi:hypothetical protein
MTDERHDPETAMERFEEFTRKVFSKKKLGSEREAQRGLW